MSGLLLGMVLSVFTCWFQNTVTLTSRLVSADFGTCLYQCALSNFTISLNMLKCSSAHTLSCLFMYCSFASIGLAVMWSVGSSYCWHSLYLLSVSVCNIFVAWYFVCNAYYYYYYYCVKLSLQNDFLKLTVRIFNVIVLSVSLKWCKILQWINAKETCEKPI